MKQRKLKKVLLTIHTHSHSHTPTTRPSSSFFSSSFFPWLFCVFSVYGVYGVCGVCGVCEQLHFVGKAINITLRTFTSAVSVCVCVFLCLDEFAMKSRLKLYTSCPVLGHSPPGSKRAGEGPNGSAPPAPMSTWHTPPPHQSPGPWALFPPFRCGSPRHKWVLCRLP